MCIAIQAGKQTTKNYLVNKQNSKHYCEYHGYIEIISLREVVGGWLQLSRYSLLSVGQGLVWWAGQAQVLGMCQLDNSVKLDNVQASQ